ncbi:regulatory protein [Streptomyces lincolnensis]|uniref:Regulatory protein n=1 Tax=Streptomyces lincolnensis TaxID=1915 RepID=A0A1B1MDJ3_STRLN|nr:TetR/AcrR family transcriptional regulator [Streptomyces lincolnensis]ANS66690.1 regulatory protein [Streptomyces lincolnensis]AXG55561.1 regulatory protein [Streptomyces lincolnensis]QMV07945.1 TetR family transcriptional regulator [Streptomyces lincolnensis]
MPRTPDALTAKGRATRARIVEGAAEVLREQGVASTTLDDIRARTGTSKSQLFHYFPDGKDELLLAVARFEADRVLQDQQPHLGRLDSWESWRRWRDVVVERYEAQGDHCPLGALFLQVGRSRPGARAIVTELMLQWQRELARGVRALQSNGLVSPSLDVDRTSAALLAGIQGGVAIMLSTGDSTHLRAALDEGIAHLRASGPAVSGSPASSSGLAPFVDRLDPV